MTIQELFSLILPRLKVEPRCSLVEAVSAVQAVIFQHLFAMRSDLIQDVFDMDFAAGEFQGRLPATFYAIESRPMLAGSLLPLSVVDKSVKHNFGSGTPLFYELRGKLLTIYPTPQEDEVVLIPAFVKPGVPVEMDDELPFDGYLDDVFADCCVAYMSTGAAGPAEKSFRAVVETQVDLLLQARSLNDEQAVADGINYER